MQLHLISGFLGSGKTTAIQTASKLLIQQGKRVGVVMNDQGIRLVDTGFFESLSIPNRQVVNGCFCCHYDALNACIQSFLDKEKTEVIFAESVGSCTDIVATVLKPLQQLRNDVQVTLSTFADARLLQFLFIDKKPLFEQSVQYIYEKQLEDAGVIVVTKTDLMNEEELALVKNEMSSRYPSKTILYINGTNEISVANWLSIVMQKEETLSLSSLQIDYDLYGAGEAMLAWLDTEILVYSKQKKAAQTALDLAAEIYQNIQKAGYPIGHFKCLLNDTIKISYTATSKEKKELLTEPFLKVKLLLNARVQTHPDVLTKLVANTIKDVQSKHDCYIEVVSSSSFQPGYPKPTHRIA